MIQVEPLLETEHSEANLVVFSDTQPHLIQNRTDLVLYRQTIELIEFTVIQIYFTVISLLPEPIREKLCQFSFTVVESDDRCGFDRIGDALTVILVHHYGRQGEYVVADCDRVVSIWWHREYYYGNLLSFTVIHMKYQLFRTIVQKTPEVVLDISLGESCRYM